MSLKVSVVVGLVVLAWSGVASADLVSDEMVSCQSKNDDEACVLPGGGAGVCVRLRDERRNRTFLTCATSRAQYPDALPAPSGATPKSDTARPQADVVVPTSKPTSTPASSASSAPGKSSGCAVSAPGATSSPVTVAALIACWTAWLVGRARWRARRTAAPQRVA